jgi:hypothetical protein
MPVKAPATAPLLSRAVAPTVVGTRHGGAMLDINPDIVCRIIRKAAQFHAKEEVVIPDGPAGAGDDGAMQVLADHRNDATFIELRTAIHDLEPDQQVTLVALMWLGRGDYDAEEWDEALAEACRRWNPHAAEYLLATPLVADYLEEGLALLDYDCR